MTTDRKTPLIILLCSLASLAFEVSLTRIFSISLSYHFAFMIISIAMLGLAASGAALAIFPRLKRLELLSIYSLLLGVAIPLSFLLANRVPFDPVQLAWDRWQLLHIALMYLILALPFFCSGLVVATAFSVQSARSWLLYGADLLGAGLGSLGILLLLTLFAPERGLLLLSIPPLLAAFLAGSPRLRVMALTCAAISIFVCIRPPDSAGLHISPYKGLPSALRFPGARLIKSYVSPFARIDTFESPAVRFAPGLSLRHLEELPPQIGLAVDGGDVTAVTAAEGEQPPAFLEELPAALPYLLATRKRVLVLDSKGGLQALVARRFGASEIVTVESNPALLRIIRDDWRAFSGEIYATASFAGLGRSWLQGRGERFDLIDISLLGTEPFGAFGIAEEYRFTIEAFREYLGHLQQDGLLSVNLYLIPPPRTELRLLATMFAALEESGVREPAQHLVVVRSWGTLCLLVKQSPLTAGDIAKIRSFCEERWFDPVYYPGIVPGESNRFVKMQSDDYFQAVAALVSPERRGRFFADYPFDVRPVRDDAPFFHYYLKPGRTGEIYTLMGKKWQFFLEEGFIVPAVFGQVAILSLLLLIMPLFAGKDLRRTEGRGRWLLPYFALLGCGFMFVETALIQRIILPLETPAIAVATVLATILVSSGSGSLLSRRFPRLQSPATAAVIALLVMVYSLSLPAASALVAPWGLPLKIGSVFILFIPLGLLLGIPFPTGLRVMGEADPLLIPWAWVINGCFSVMAPVLAIMVATLAGFTAVLALGAAAYLLAFLNLCLFQRAGRA